MQMRYQLRHSPGPSPPSAATREMLANGSVGHEIGPVPGADRLLVVRREPETAPDLVLAEHAVGAVLDPVQAVRELPRPAHQPHQADLHTGPVEHHDPGLAEP